VREVLLPKPRGELLDGREGVGVDALQHVHEVGVGIDAVERAGRDQALDLPDALRPEVRPAEEPVLGAPGKLGRGGRPMEA
jgi:hypothetical protein